MSSKKKPNIVTPFNDRKRFKELVQEVINDTTIFTHVPDSISLDGVLFTITLTNKKFNFDELKVDSLTDYIDIYLSGVKKSSKVYSVTDNGSNIVIETTEAITLNPESIVRTDFVVKGKIVNR
jgi:ribosome biogenesis SPOUT family RNA methylase Rps3